MSSLPLRVMKPLLPDLEGPSQGRHIDKYSAMPTGRPTFTILLYTHVIRFSVVKAHITKAHPNPLPPFKQNNHWPYECPAFHFKELDKKKGWSPTCPSLIVGHCGSLD